jgi:hypothetical protein
LNLAVIIATGQPTNRKVVISLICYNYLRKWGQLSKSLIEFFSVYEAKYIPELKMSSGNTLSKKLQIILHLKYQRSSIHNMSEDIDIDERLDRRKRKLQNGFESTAEATRNNLFLRHANIKGQSDLGIGDAQNVNWNSNNSGELKNIEQANMARSVKMLSWKKHKRQGKQYKTYLFSGYEPHDNDNVTTIGVVTGDHDTITLHLPIMVAFQK